jgi:hypothetical protein
LVGPHLRGYSRNVKAEKLVVLVLALVAAASVALAPAGMAAKSRSFAISYRTNETPKSKLLLKRDGYRLTGRCTSENGAPEFIVKNGTKPGALLFAGLAGQPANPSYYASTNTAQPATNDVSSTRMLTEMVSYQENGDVATAELLLDRGIARRDCVIAGVFTIVSRAESFLRTVPDNSSTQAFSQGGLKADGQCNSETNLRLAVTSSTPPANAFAGTDLGGTGHEVALFPLDTENGVTNFDLFAISDLNFSVPSGKVTAANVGIDSFPGCTVAGRVQTASRGSKLASYARNPTSKHKRTEFFDKGGLHLSASCAAGQMKVFAATSVKHALLRSSIYGDGDPALIFKNDFSSKPAKPFYMLDFESIHRSGQLVYATPDGHATTIDWSGANQGSAYKQCLFSGIASSA